MAKVKQIKSMQERLEDAIVPKEQAPFAIPENWCWVKVGSIAKILNGYAFKSPQYVSEGIRIIRISNVQDGYIVDEKPVYYSFDTINEIKEYLLFEGDLLFSLTGNVGRVALLTANFLPAALNQRVACIRSINSIVNIKYLFYFFQTPLIFEKFQAAAKGIAQQNLSTESIKNSNITLAPIEEQKRIVDKIELLFSRLDEAKELILNSLDEFEDRKSTILHKAFNGELTACYRKQNEISWKNCVLNDVADYKKGPFGSSITKAMFVEKGESTYKVYEQGNAIRKTINYGRYYISEKKFQELKSFEVKGGDIIVSCAGTIGETFMLPENCERGIINQALMRVRLYDNIVPQYFIYYFGEVLKQDVNSKAKGIAIKNIPRFSVLKQLPIKLPPLQEQQEIVRILDGFFEKEDKSKELLDMIDQIEEMKKSILARAFRGELGTHSDTDEPAIELLRKILK